MTSIDKSQWTDEHHEYADPKYRHNVWSGNPNGSPVRKDRCRFRVFSNHLFYQCSRPNSNQGLWCGVHNPPAMARREEKRKARAAEENERWRLKSLRKQLQSDAVKALQLIAEGKAGNDPVDIAKMVLDEYKEIL